MVGLFTFLTIGSAVLVDLWDILDYKKGYAMVVVFRICHNLTYAFALGSCVEAFLRESTFTHRPAFLRLSLLLLDSLQGAEVFRSWGHLHESRFPGDPSWK